MVEQKHYTIFPLIITLVRELNCLDKYNVRRVDKLILNAFLKGLSFFY